MSSGNFFVLIVLGLVLLPFYVMVLSMFFHMGKMAAMKSILKSTNQKKD